MPATIKRQAQNSNVYRAYGIMRNHSGSTVRPHHRGDWKANGTGEIAAEKTRPSNSVNGKRRQLAHHGARTPRV